MGGVVFADQFVTELRSLTFFPKRERDCKVGQGERKRQIKNLRLKFERGGFLILSEEETLAGIDLSFYLKEPQFKIKSYVINQMFKFHIL